MNNMFPFHHLDGCMQHFTSTTTTNATSENLALKGIMDIYVMAQISKGLWQDPIETTYYPVSRSTLDHLRFLYEERTQNLGKNYVQQWQSRIFSLDHVIAQYGDTTWGI